MPIAYRYEVTGFPTGPGSTADRVASGSFNSDGVPDIVLGTGPGKPAQFTIIEADVFYSDGGPKSFAAETLGVAVSP